MSAPPDNRSTFIVRTDGRWWATDIRSGRSEAATLDEVLALVRAAPAATTRPADRPEVGTAPPASTGPGVETGWWRPTWMWVGEVADGVLVVDVGVGDPLLLDPDDLAVLDAVEGPSELGAISRRAGVDPDACRERLHRLAVGGRLLQPADPQAPAAPSGNGAAPEPEPAAEPSRPRAPASGPLRRLSRLLRRAAPTTNGTAMAPASPPEVAGVDEDLTAGEAPAPAATPRADPDGRIPLYAIWHSNAGPLLSLGMLTATARAHDGGKLAEVFEIRRPETAESFLEDLRARGGGPAVLLCSDYVWSLERNLAAARAARQLSDQLVVVHGGPSCPKYEADAVRFLDEHGDVADVLVRGEGESVLPLLLEAVAAAGDGDLEPLLDGIPGITFRRRSGEIVRNPDQERIADLDTLPSPYLTGEFDDIDPSAWPYCLSIETTRGCPYGCTFCDWGSSTMSRIRKFSLERVVAEVEWAASRGINTLNLTDANFGIISRDVETARAIAAIKERTGFPRDVAFYPAKNTTKHLAEIMDVLLAAGIIPAGSLSLQTSDPTSLAAVERSNISTEHYVRLAAEYRRRGLPLHGDLLIGIPAQTYDSFRRDLQFNLDHEIMSRTWQVQLLPNAPMNAPEYRQQFEIRSDETGRVVSTNTFDEHDRQRMLRLRRLDIIFERYGVLRHVMRVLQWDHGVDATILMDDVLGLTESDPLRYPLLTWITTFFDRHPTCPVGWGAFYAEVRRFIEEQYGVGIDSSLETAFALQEFLMPAPGRTFPAEIQLEHDYLGYYREATASLYAEGHAGKPARPLAAWPPATFVVEGDPLELCTVGMSYPSQARDATMENDFVIGGSTAYELESELLRFLPWVAGNGIRPRIPEVPVALT